MDIYLTLMDDLYSSLRQVWFNLASAKYSMGASRINTTILDLKVHSASTTTKLSNHHGNFFRSCHHASTTIKLSHHHADSMENEPHFSLRKWGFLEGYGEEKLQEKSSSPQLWHHDHPQHSGEKSSVDATLTKVDDQVQKKRSKSLCVFGVLVSPKL